MKKFHQKLDLFFWFLVAILPLIIFIVSTWNNPEALSFSEIIIPYRFNFIADIFNQIFTENLSFPVTLVDYLSYFVSVEIIHVFIDFVVFLPRLAHNLIGRLSAND